MLSFFGNVSSGVDAALEKVYPGSAWVEVRGGQSRALYARRPILAVGMRSVEFQSAPDSGGHSMVLQLDGEDYGEHCLDIDEKTLDALAMRTLITDVLATSKFLVTIQVVARIKGEYVTLITMTINKMLEE